MTMPLVGGSAGELRQTMANIFAANGLPAMARAYSHAAVPFGYDLVVESDTSITGERQYQGIEWVPVEVKTRILNGTDDYDRVVGKLLELCRYLGARVNASTGHHIHVEVTEVRNDPSVIRSLYNITHRVEPVIFGVVSPSRRNNRFCLPLPDRSRLLHDCNRLEDFRDALNAAGLERYWAVNLTHLFSPAPRVEFRHHAGTLDFEKAKHWRNLCVRLIDHSVQRTCKATKVQLANDQESLLRMLVTLGLKPNSRVYAKVSPELRATGRFLLRRWKHLNLRADGSLASRAIPPSPDEPPGISFDFMPPMPSQ